MKLRVEKGETYYLKFAKIPTYSVWSFIELGKGLNKSMSETCAQGGYFFRELEFWAVMSEI